MDFYANFPKKNNQILQINTDKTISNCDQVVSYKHQLLKTYNPNFVRSFCVFFLNHCQTKRTKTLIYFASSSVKKSTCKLYRLYDLKRRHFVVSFCFFFSLEFPLYD